MAKTITIPKEFGYPTADFWVEGIKYTYETGKAVLVDDKVAEIVSNAAALDPKEGAPGAGGIFMVNVEVDSNDRMMADKTAAECLNAFNAGRMMVCRVNYRGSNSYLSYSVIDLTSCNKVGLSSGTIEFSGITCIAGHVLNVSILLGGSNLVAVNDIT